MKESIQETINAFVSDLQPQLISDDDRSDALIALLKAFGPWGVQSMSGISKGESWILTISTLEDGSKDVSFSRGTSSSS